ncbi:hypothetical protein ASPTUDRAFT_503826 [Aspergillus tubingensis CBS 134.48]|uniref:Uncharacterized protein n=1 Tax=Aspergillus tubingensis (strain CBS 134.48) TaxID=767770 RepID=A0A1L9NCH8_ASPTC|nr:hypothetical protein ASPTUDRAFT_503826 [Aspergillus tubingensis CBS 134.48]
MTESQPIPNLLPSISISYLFLPVHYYVTLCLGLHLNLNLNRNVSVSTLLYRSFPTSNTYTIVCPCRTCVYLKRRTSRSKGHGIIREGSKEWKLGKGGNRGKRGLYLQSIAWYIQAT